MPAIPERPTRMDAEEALRLLEDLLGGFPFVDDVAKACALSAIITPVVRGAFSVTPMHASRAPTAGSGKSFLWDIVVGHCYRPAHAGYVDRRKRGGNREASRRGNDGGPAVNLPRQYLWRTGGDALCQIIERPVVDIRILGRVGASSHRAGGTCVFATGNNFTIVGDVCRRRSLPTWTRRWSGQSFASLISIPSSACWLTVVNTSPLRLTICRAYFVAGRPEKVPRLASFEGWSDTVRSALIWLGKEDR